jgi:hypothetical protein
MRALMEGLMKTAPGKPNVLVSGGATGSPAESQLSEGFLQPAGIVPDRPARFLGG